MKNLGHTDLTDSREVTSENTVLNILPKGSV